MYFGDAGGAILIIIESSILQICKQSLKNAFIDIKYIMYILITWLFISSKHNI